MGAAAPPEILEQFQALPTRQRAYLVALAETGVCRKACDAARIDYTLPWKWRRMDGGEVFAELEAEARRLGSEVLVREAYRRAVEGLTRKKFTKDGAPIIDPATGEQYVELEYSDTLLLRLLESTRPEFRRSYDVTHSGEVTHTHTFVERLAAAKERALAAKRPQLAS